tara:strand:- start:1282 stop:2502 length:1221 start_codon:yes stop_codon:yes gene_type:complete
MKFEKKGLQEKQGRLYEQQKEIYAVAKEDGRTALNEEEGRKYDKIEQDYVKLEEDVKRLSAMEAKEGDSSSAIEKMASKKDMSKDEYKEKYSKAFTKHMRNQPMSADEQGVLTRGTSTQVAGTTTLGGFFVPEEWANVINVQRAHIGSVKSISNVINTTGGGTLPYPNFNDTGVSAVPMTEGTAPAVSDITVGNTNLGDHTYTSGILKVSFQLMNDEAVDFVDLVGVTLGKRLERGIATDLVTGDNSGNPDGFLTAINPHQAGGDGGTFTASDVYDLEGSLDREYSQNGTFVLNNSTLSVIKALQIGSGDARPLWAPSFRDGEPHTIIGHPYLVSADMPDIAAAAKYLAFGDFSNYTVRTVGGMNMLRMNERFADALSVGFIAWERVDGQLTGPASSIKYIYRTAT